ncbi:galactoside-binding lectin, partial [Teladorsagia circumcincta]
MEKRHSTVSTMPSHDQHVIIYGIATGDSWTVELTGSGGNALFQIVAKYKEKVVTRNANIGGNWGQEEKVGQFPFQRDRGFDLSIANLPSGLQ